MSKEKYISIPESEYKQMESDLSQWRKYSYEHKHEVTLELYIDGNSRFYGYEQYSLNHQSASYLPEEFKKHLNQAVDEIERLLGEKIAQERLESTLQELQENNKRVEAKLNKIPKWIRMIFTGK